MEYFSTGVAMGAAVIATGSLFKSHPLCASAIWEAKTGLGALMVRGWARNRRENLGG